MFEFDAFLQEVRAGAVVIAQREAKDFVTQAGADADRFARTLRADLEIWTGHLAAGQMTAADFAFLVRGKKDLAEMQALTQAGLAAIRIDRIRAAVIDLVITAAGKMV